MSDFDIFYAAAKAMTHGASPYAVPGFFNPVWALIPFLPLIWFDKFTAHNIYTIASALSLIIALIRFKVWPPAIIVFAFFTPFVFDMITLGNIDPLVILGITFPVPIAIWFAFAKPQVTFVVILLWAIQGHWKTVAIGLVVFIANYITLGLPHIQEAGSWGKGGADLFPFAIPIGIFLIRKAIESNSKSTALVSSGFLSPYYSLPSWLTILPIAKTWKLTVIAFAMIWAVYISYSTKIIPFHILK